MGQSPSCCTKESDKDLGRKVIPVDVVNKILEPELNKYKPTIPNPYCSELYG